MRERKKTKVHLMQCSNARVGHSLLPMPGAEPLGGVAAPGGSGAGLRRIHQSKGLGWAGVVDGRRERKGDEPISASVMSSNRTLVDSFSSSICEKPEN
jgi:hypothetical protein